MTDTELKKRKAICDIAGVKEIDDVSDGFHTFRQLYYQRMMLFAAIVKQNKGKAWKSLRHENGELCFGGGWFIVGVDTPEGGYTYHYEDNYFSLFDCEELDRGKHWDGHTEKDVTRLLSLPSTQPEEDKLKEIANALSEKMCYMNTCPNERDIILGYLGRKRPNTNHCNTDCWKEECESYHYETRKQSESCGDMVSRQAAIDAIEEVDWYHQNKNKDMVHGANSQEHQAWYKADDIYQALTTLPSAQLEIKPIDYQDCANAMLRMWMDEVVTDGEYNRIVDKLNAFWRTRNERSD